MSSGNKKTTTQGNDNSKLIAIASIVTAITAFLKVVLEYIIYFMK